jgi:hypothetical protein
MVLPTRTTALALILAVLALAGVSGWRAHGDALGDKSAQMLQSWLDKVMESAPVKIKPQKVIAIEDDALQQLFPDDRFYGVYFATWPVAPRLPKELAHETLVLVHRAESIDPIRGQDGLKSFLAQALADIRDESRAAAAATASLRLAEAVSKAGTYPFGTPEVTVARQAANIVATAQAAATEYDLGEITVRLEFGPDGKAKPDAIQIEDRTRRAPPAGR